MNAPRDAADWASRTAPDLAAFEVMARDAYAGLPDDFLKFCGELVILIEDFPTDEMLDSLELESPFDLLGLFEGLGLAQAGDSGWTGREPNRIWLFRRPILDYWADHEETLGGVISHVLIHEIGHHFGLSDDDMEAIEAAAD
ncbi:metallopeptidase family protein [Breoghania sp. L-A4]|uniref:metallopeptidase family protein n=1 Tax=Breoghania sp. L-A4 TaxID=2304600 RepID=UPI000E358962|nr:metallopeptidase family protein [Breoghania sp. L-A4]AXS42105.1 Zn-dependent protease [Breoghania sp. L-A4]